MHKKRNFHEGHSTVREWQGSGRVAAVERHGMCESAFNTAWERHGMCESAFNTAWERHGMCESAFRNDKVKLLICVLFECGGQKAVKMRRHCTWVSCSIPIIVSLWGLWKRWTIWLINRRYIHDAGRSVELNIPLPPHNGSSCWRCIRCSLWSFGHEYLLVNGKLMLMFDKKPSGGYRTKGRDRDGVMTREVPGGRARRPSFVIHSIRFCLEW
jgi:hypothetical protein